MGLSIRVRLRKTKGWDWRELEQLASDIGYVFISQSGSHRKFFCSKTKDPLIIPANKDLRRTDSGIIMQLRKTWRLVNKQEDKVAILWRDMIRTIREDAGFTQIQVGDAIGIGMQAIYQLEKRKRLFTINEFKAWCFVMKIKFTEQKWMRDFDIDPIHIKNRDKKLIQIIKIPVPTRPQVQKRIAEPEIEKMEVVMLPPVQSLVRRVDSDIITGGELALSRFRELEKLMNDAEKYRSEYERLKRWLTEGNDILGV